MKAIFRVENKYGTRDYNSLSEAKKNSSEDEYITFSYDWQKLSERKRKYASRSWAKKCSEKFGIDFDE